MSSKSIVNFPDHLIEEFAYKRGVPFIGAGLSATARNDNGNTLPTWSTFINQAKGMIRENSDKKKKLVDNLLASQDQLKALQVIRDYSDPGDYQKIVKDTFTAKGYSESLAHKALRRLDSKITITTNFDNIYENYCKSINNKDLSAYVVNSYNREKNIVTNIRSSENLIIKAHGTVEEPEDIIFTQFDYLKAKREHPCFYEILSSIFLLNTVLFIGYGINDPDINLLLSSELNNIAMGTPDYVLLPENTFTVEEKRNWEKNFNVVIVPYENGSDGDIYGNFEDVIREFSEAVLDMQVSRGMIPSA